VELLFVLYALLAGKRKAEIQDRLAGLGLITTATALFDKTDWLKPPAPLAPYVSIFTPSPPIIINIIRHERAPHGPQCECNPDAALKIQLLRLILNFCDGDFENRHNKLLLLSLEELHALYGATPGATLPATTHFERSAVSGPGLLSKLIRYLHYFTIPSTPHPPLPFLLSFNIVSQCLLQTATRPKQQVLDGLMYRGLPAWIRTDLPKIRCQIGDAGFPNRGHCVRCAEDSGKHADKF
jgi:hypothetical protein